MGVREPEKDWQGAVPWCPSTGKSLSGKAELREHHSSARAVRAAFLTSTISGRIIPLGELQGPSSSGNRHTIPHKHACSPRYCPPEHGTRREPQGGWSLKTLSSRASSLRALRSSVPRGVSPRGTVRPGAGRTGSRSPVPSMLLGTVLLGNRLPVPAAASSRDRLLQRCLPPPPAAEHYPLLWRPRPPPGVMMSSRPPRAPRLARPRHPAASSEGSRGGAPRLAGGPGTGINRPAGAAEGGGLERGPTLGHPGSGAQRRPRREPEGSAAALEPGYRARQAARGRAGYGAGGLRGRRWWQGPVHGGLSAESPSGAVRLVAAGRVGPPCPEAGGRADAGPREGPEPVVPTLLGSWPGGWASRDGGLAPPPPRVPAPPFRPGLLPQGSQTPPRDRARLHLFDPRHTLHPLPRRPYQVTPDSLTANPSPASVLIQ